MLFLYLILISSEVFGQGGVQMEFGIALTVASNALFFSLVTSFVMDKKRHERIQQYIVVFLWPIFLMLLAISLKISEIGS